MLRLAIKTLGCRANRYESDRLLTELEGKARMAGVDEEADIVVINTCTVTHVADRKSRQTVSQLRREHPGAKVVVFGCGARMARQQYEEMEGVDFIARDRGELREYVEGVANEPPLAPPSQGGERTLDSRTRGLVKIQDGCDRFCSYCIIPFARGKPVSFPGRQILDEIREKEAQGYKEVVLTGINIGTWREEERDFADLLKMILQESSIPRVRISSIEPCDFSEKFYGLMGEARICKHLHLCLQSGADAVLKTMKRPYSRGEFLKICSRLKEVAPEIAITTDVITGFPGETEEDFDEGMRFIKSAGFAKLHVFPYSKRQGTLAAGMEGQVPYSQKKEWAQRLISLSRELERGFKERFFGEEMDVLFEEMGANGKWEGYTSNYIRVAVESGCHGCSRGAQKAVRCSDLRVPVEGGCHDCPSMAAETALDLSNTIQKVKLMRILSHDLVEGELV